MALSGISTPVSSSSTLSSPPSPVQKGLDPIAAVYNNPRIPASSVIEFIASRRSASSAVYVYELAEQVGFGTLTKEWAKSRGTSVPVIDLQTRAGAGLSLVGRLSEGTSQDTVRGTILTAYTTPEGLASMAASLISLPPATTRTRLILQVPTVTPSGENFTFLPTLAPLATALTIIPNDLTILLSATPQQSVDFATLSYRLSTHVIHLFDHHSSTREFGHSIAPLELAVTERLSVKEAVTQAGYSLFECVGDVTALTAVVLLNGPLAQAAKAVASELPGLAVLIVNVLRPWDEEAFRQALPPSVRTVHVLDDVNNLITQGPLFIEVLGSIASAGPQVAVLEHRTVPMQTQKYITERGSFARFLAGLLPQAVHSVPTLFTSTQKRLLLFSTPQSPLATLSHVVEDLFLTHGGISPRMLSDYDAFSRPGGIAVNRLLLAPHGEVKSFVPMPLALPFDAESPGQADFLAILDQGLLSSHSLLHYAKPSSPVLLVTSWTPEELMANLPVNASNLIVERDLRIFSLDARALASKLVGTSGPTNEAIQNLLVHLAFLRLYLGTAATESVVLKVAEGAYGDTIQGFLSQKVNAYAWSGLQEVVLPPSPSASKEKAPAPLRNFEFNAISVEADGDTIVNGAKIGSWHEAAKHLLFPAVYASSLRDVVESEYPRNPALRPEVPDHTYLVTCTVNRRLTPLEYDRNVFHLEFDTKGTGLKYAIGEALGIHGWNDEQDVLEFCNWYGVDLNRLITIPVPGDECQVHTRTAFQALQQQIDLFGRPPKSFYTDLAPYAASPVDRHALLFIGSPEGSSSFKKLSDKDTVTFADVLRRYPTARPPIEVLCGLVGDIKPRHYSIASAQSVVGDRVDLLVVTVEWQAPDGTARYGQCTRYLAGLRVGQKVTVSIKPSVMKLPPSPKQPLIMAGLGTGAAPFRAFLQHLAWLAHEQGQEIGPVYYYFGSRHQSQEYLYGEEIETFIQDSIITRAGLAFSRDGPKKVYIQHKMLEDADALAKMLHDHAGVFYLCGPTWPVPDVYEALVNALAKYKGITTQEAGEYLESLKEEERYVLEVY
ncbi:assimilatory sulfite reductase [Pluteus cervinus]|uniref:Assimilatory sulfite reductase n=1 Tax=Pluteus cervinus TaxID=181527 RepID=A0ACD3BG96_9AGAR|nr:assimilatory sulfite reductase [Pluteus cervinus]